MAVVRRIEARVDRVIRHTVDVCTYELIPDGKVPRFRPGQFLHLALDPYDPSRDWPESRVFSIASAPTRRDMIRITISAKGKFTTRIIDELKKGSHVWLKLPYGEFTFKDHPMVLIAGGTGVAPFISHLESCLDKHTDQPIKLYYGVRSPEHLMFSEIIQQCLQQLPGFSSVTYVESEPWNGCREGMLDINTIHSETMALAAKYYLSGPWSMIDSFRTKLKALGVETYSIHIDEWE